MMTLKHTSLLLLLAVGCRAEKVDEPVDPVTEPSSEEASTVDETVVGEGALEPEDTLEARQRIRMNVDQLSTSMAHITGVEWMDGNQNLWDEYSTTLGVPNYQETVSEDLSANVIFQKFLQDAATYSCQAWIEHDGYAGPYAFFEDAYDEGDMNTVQGNLVYLRKVVHGHFSEEDPMLHSLEDLHALVYQRTQDHEMTWKTVCVALFTHPDFYTY